MARDQPPGSSRTPQKPGTYLWFGDEGQCSELPIAMVWVPSGVFLRGSANGQPGEEPEHLCELSKGFYMARFPTTVAEYKRIAAQAKHSWTPPLFAHDDKHPVVNVTWDDAVAYCKWGGFSLPTEAQWEYAARGIAGWKYPWGNDDPTDDHLWWSGHTRLAGTCPVGEHTSGASLWGAEDMAGNVWEWVADWHGPYPPAGGSLVVDPRGPVEGTYRVLRGGGWHSDVASWVRAAFRARPSPALRNSDLGFRCVR